MVSKPDFDPNTLAGHDTRRSTRTTRQLLAAPGDPLDQPTIGGNLNPPGSTFKLVMASAALGIGQVHARQSSCPTCRRSRCPQQHRRPQRHVHARAARAPRSRSPTRRPLAATSRSPSSACSSATTPSATQAEKYGFNNALSSPDAGRRRASTPSTPMPAQIAQSSASGRAQMTARPRCRWRWSRPGIANGGVVMYPNMVDSMRSAGPVSPIADVHAADSRHARPRRRTAATMTQMMVDNVNHGAAH